jgi:hypothetical protein
VGAQRAARISVGGNAVGGILLTAEAKKKARIWCLGQFSSTLTATIVISSIRHEGLTHMVRIREEKWDALYRCFLAAERATRLYRENPTHPGLTEAMELLSARVGLIHEIDAASNRDFEKMRKLFEPLVEDEKEDQ